MGIKMRSWAKQFGLVAFAAVLAVTVFTGCEDGSTDPDPVSLTNWTAATVPANITGTFSNIAYGKGVFVAATNNREILWSNSGTSWNYVVQSGAQNLTNNTDDTGLMAASAAYYVFFGNDEFIAVNRKSSDTRWLKSSDGKVWTAVTGGSGQAAGGGAYGGSKWIVGSNGANVYTSTDTTTWTQQGTELTDAPSINWINGVAFGNGTFVISGMAGRIGSSTDGTTWTDRTPLTVDGTEKLFGGAVGSSGNQAAVNQVIFAADQGKFIAVGGNPGMQQIAATSPDGITWTQTGDIKITMTTNYLYAGYGAGIYIIAHQSGGEIPASYSTNNGASWTAIDDTKLTGVTGIAYGAGKFVMVGGTGIAYSIP
ncbi:hypothetical protein AGMMS49944_21710 [Spirochaetia bacterium]|nr:hypothetical protein AGMMS49944_21710 [Spirochaetia bacterium]